MEMACSECSRADWRRLLAWRRSSKALAVGAMDRAARTEPKISLTVLRAAMARWEHAACLAGSNDQWCVCIVVLLFGLLTGWPDY